MFCGTIPSAVGSFCRSASSATRRRRR